MLTRRMGLLTLAVSLYFYDNAGCRSILVVADRDGPDGNRRTVGGVFCISRRHGAHGDGTIRKRHLAAKRRTSGEGEGVRGAVEREDAGKTDRDEDTKSKQNPICKGGEVPSKL